MLRFRTRPARILGPTAAALLVLSMAGCVAEPAPTPADPVVTSPPAELVEAPLPTKPMPWIDIECEDLLGDIALEGYFDASITPRSTALSGRMYYSQIPDSFAIRQVGGMTCEWAIPGTPQPGDPGFRGVVINVLPNASDQWQRASDESYGFASEHDYRCADWGCEASVLLDTGTWIQVTYGPDRGLPGLSDLEAISDAAESAIATATPRKQSWEPPTGTVVVEPLCEFPVSVDQVQAALGLDVPMLWQMPHGGWSMEAGAEMMTGSDLCWWAAELDEWMSYAKVDWLPGGAWAYTEAGTPRSTPFEFETVSLNGLTDGDAARLFCDEDGIYLDPTPYCFIDIAVNGNWFYAEVRATGGQHGSAGVLLPLANNDKRTAVSSIAQSIVDAVKAKAKES